MMGLATTLSRLARLLRLLKEMNSLCSLSTYSTRFSGDSSCLSNACTGPESVRPIDFSYFATASSHRTLNWSFSVDISGFSRNVRMRNGIFLSPLKLFVDYLRILILCQIPKYGQTQRES